MPNKEVGDLGNGACRRRFARSVWGVRILVSCANSHVRAMCKSLIIRGISFGTLVAVFTVGKQVKTMNTMEIETILCPVDFSEFNLAANAYASTLAAATGARIIYLHTFLTDVHDVPSHFDAAQTRAELLVKMKEFVRPENLPKVEASYVVEFGLPAEGIINYAAKHDVDLIVMGTHGRSGVLRLLMGSVAESVVRRAGCPVLAIKTKADVAVEMRDEKQPASREELA